MIDPNENLIYIDGESKTKEIEYCQYVNGRGIYAVKFTSSPKLYHYKREKVLWMRNPSILNPKDYKIVHRGRPCENITTLLLFTSGFRRFFHIQYASKRMIDYSENEIEIILSCLSNNRSQNVFNYFKDVAYANPLETDEGRKILAAQYDKIDFINDEMAIAPYLYPQKYKNKSRYHDNLIFPFSCNNSQVNAVRQAFTQQISIIQGPPGTGKTQTILNIIANILLMGKTVIIVSNNNSATDNVLEKLTKYNLDFLVAPLGNQENKQQFIANQKDKRRYPDELQNWNYQITDNNIKHELAELQKIFTLQEKQALLRQELSATEIEWEHFKHDFGEDIDIQTEASSESILKFMAETSLRADKVTDTLWSRIKWWIRHFIYKYYYKINSEFLSTSPELAINKIHYLFYKKRIEELQKELGEISAELDQSDVLQLTKQLNEKSQRILQLSLYNKFGKSHEPYTIKEDSLYFEANEVIKEFPIILSTTFSAQNSLHNMVYDYLIMDEASQVSPETGVLALSCAKNAIIVGDNMQLPNVVSREMKEKLDVILNKYDVDKGYDCSSNSFLQSIIKIIPSVPQTLLREHYRCAPDIIEFCNQKFYGGNLIIMTKNDNDNTLYVKRTSKGNLSRQHTNQREVDVICNEILPSLCYDKNEIGIIAPYRDQVGIIKNAVGNEIDVATVHKFQGREKDVIIISVVDSQISDFADNPNLLNVAISRAKKKLVIVVSGNEQERKGNITDLLDYIEYHQHGQVAESRIHSIYDMLYKQYDSIRFDYLKTHTKVSEYDSENLTYALIEDIIKNNPTYSCLDVLCHYPMNMLIKDYSPLSDEERKYASHHSTHMDFLIYNKVSKKPLLAIEVDGWTYHQKGSKQSERDNMKNHILPLYGVDILRLSTTGSEEQKSIEEKMKVLLGE
ncbi:MAG: AAA family ATPase [Prevotella sp.]|nr:AAA family ATPase [Prevotella sp.]